MISERDVSEPQQQLHLFAVFSHYLASTDVIPQFIQGDAFHTLCALPNDSIDFCMTSPPYWNKRQYTENGIGMESTPAEYIYNLMRIFAEVKRVMKPSGSFWLNSGDTYLNKNLLGLPWRIAIKLMDEQQWILRNSIIWNKIKGGMDNTTDRLGNVHEHIFHFVKTPNGYYFNADAIRTTARSAKVINDTIVSATGVSGVRYRRQIELSTALDAQEKTAALIGLQGMLGKIRSGEISDFRMIIRKQQRTTHSDSAKVSGRAKEIRDKGFYFLRYHPKGSKPSDVWDILPEDTQNRTEHFAAYPEDLCKIPLLATCPPAGIVLDPFCGTGTTMLAAYKLGRKSIGIDLSLRYLTIAESRMPL